MTGLVSVVAAVTAATSQGMHATRVPLQRLLAVVELRPRHSTPAALCNNRRMDKPYGKPPCCRIARTCLAAAHANGWPLCAYATASSKSCVLGHPCLASGNESRKQPKGNRGSGFSVQDEQQRFLLNLNAIFPSTLTYPARSNPLSLCHRRWRFQSSLLCTRSRPLGRNADRAADSIKCPRA